MCIVDDLSSFIQVSAAGINSCGGKVHRGANLNVLPFSLMRKIMTGENPDGNTDLLKRSFYKSELKLSDLVFLLKEQRDQLHILPPWRASLERHGSTAGRRRCLGCGRRRQTGHRRAGRWRGRPCAGREPSGASADKQAQDQRS